MDLLLICRNALGILYQSLFVVLDWQKVARRCARVILAGALVKIVLDFVSMRVN
jgi:hypothetical protein